MLQQDTPEDFVIASGKQSSIRDFINISAEKLGIKLKFNGKGIEEYAQVIEVDKSISPQVNEGDIIIKVDQRYFRPAEVETLLGDASYASKKLGWKSKISVDKLCEEMIIEDLKEAKKNAFFKDHGHDISLSKED